MEPLTEPRHPPAAASGRRCRRRPVEPGGARPSEVLVAFFAPGLAMLAGAGAAMIVSALGGPWWWHWLALHLALLGGVSQLVLGAGQFFVCAFLATTPPSRRLLAAQVMVWNLGTVLVAVGVPAALPPLVDAGGGLVGLGLALLAFSFHRMQRRSLQRARWAVRWYQASAACLAAGALAGVLLAGGMSWRDGSLLGAHLALNLIGWLGTAIVGTLHTFFPSLTGTRLRHERLQGPTLRLWLSGVAATALSAAFALAPLAVFGWLALTVAAMLLAANLLASLRARTAPLSLPARLVALAQGFLVAGLGLALGACVLHGTAGPLEPPIRPVLAALLLAGWIGLTVAGSLLHLLAVLARIRHLTTGLPAPRPARDRATAAVCALAAMTWALAAVGGLTFLRPIALAVRVGATLIIGAETLRAVHRLAGGLAPRRVD